MLFISGIKLNGKAYYAANWPGFLDTFPHDKGIGKIINSYRFRCFSFHGENIAYFCGNVKANYKKIF